MGADAGTVDEQGIVDQAVVESFMDRVFGDYAGANAFFMGAIGDRLGLFKDLAERGPATSAELAERTGLHERYLREWLGGMVVDDQNFQALFRRMGEGCVRRRAVVEGEAKAAAGSRQPVEEIG